MTQLFSAVLGMSWKGSAVIGVVLLLRLLLKKAPRVWSYALWSVVLFRLLCPVSVESKWSVLRVGTQYREREVHTVTAAQPVGPIRIGEIEVLPVPAGAVSEPAAASAPSAARSEVPVWVCVWGLGVLLMAGRGGVSLLALKRRLRGAAYRGENVYEAEELETAFVMGLLAPRIYLPTGLTREERTCVLCHERHHIARCDHVTRALAFAALCLHWFNPLVWLAFRLAGKDMEMSCDEAVLKKLGGESRAAYSQSLLNLATGCRMALGTPLAFGEGDTKGRIMNVLKWKKPKIWVTVIAMLVCVVGICACAADPEVPEKIVENERAQWGSIDSWRCGLAFDVLAPGEAVFAEQNIVLVEEGRVDYHITYARAGLTMEVGLLAGDGTEYVSTVEGGSEKASFAELPAGKYQPFVRNGEDPSEHRANISPNASGAATFDLTGSGDYFEVAEPEGTTEPVTEPVEEAPTLPDDAQNVGRLPGLISLSQELHHAVLEHHRSDRSDENFCCASIVVLANEVGTRMHPVTGDDLTTMNYFLWVLYQEYQFTENGIVEVSGAHIPANITLTANPDGSWSVLNYWEPRDGSYYAEDIRAIFPGDSANDALDSQKYILAQKQDCYAQAVSWAKVSANAELDADAVISGLLDEICSSPLESSNPKDYAAEHSIEYRELKYYGDYTRDYCERHLAALEDIKSYPANVDLRARVMEMLLGELNA